MVVAEARGPKRGYGGAYSQSQDRLIRAHQRERFERGRHLVPGQPVVAVTTSGLYLDEPAVEQLGQMVARRGRGDPGEPGEFASCQGATRHQRAQDLRARRVGYEPGHRSKIGIGHTATLERRRFQPA